MTDTCMSRVLGSKQAGGNVVHNVVINGRFLTQPVTGVQRVAREMLTALDGLLSRQVEGTEQLRFSIALPEAAVDDLELDVIDKFVIKGGKGHFWEQVTLPKTVNSTDFLLCLCNTGPIAHRNQLVFIHDAAVFSMPSGYSRGFRVWYRFLHRALARVGVRIATVSEFSRKELAAHLKIAEQSIVLISNGVDHVLNISPNQEKLRALGLESGKYVLAVGSIHPNKNLAPLVTLAPELKKLGYPLVLVGAPNSRVFNGSQRERPLKESDVAFSGRVTDQELVGLYAQAGCFVFPSRYEGFGLPPLEAMSLGCPVISSRSASLPEVLGDAAEYVDASSSFELLATITRVMRNEGLRTEMRSKGLKQAQLYLWETAASALFAFICSHLGESNRARSNKPHQLYKSES